MSMMHGVFTRKLLDLAETPDKMTRKSIAEDLIAETREGVTPEGMGGGCFMPSMVQVGAKILVKGAELNQATPSAVQKPRWIWGAASLAHQKGVLPILIEVANLALKYSKIDMMFYEGLRTLERQKKLVATGMSKTLMSKHLAQPDGFGYAMDLVPIINGVPKWDWEGCYKIACAVDRAATELGCDHQIRWGGAWDRRLSDFGGDWEAYRAEAQAYANRHPGKDFLDGPHFEWVV